MNQIMKSALLISAFFFMGISTAQAAAHPNLQRAIRQIDHSIFILRHEAPDVFGGHKAAAILELERARQQLMIAERFAA